MVLPPPTLAQGQAAEAEWLRELRRWLHLGRNGVIVMIREAQRSGLRSLLLTLESVGDVLVTADARELLECEPGGLALLLVDEQDLPWLNLNRPIFVQRSLRVVMWVESALTGAIKFQSPDLHDWISHFVKCPPGVPAFAVEGLRVGSTWWPGVAWDGPGLELALSQLEIDARTLLPGDPFEGLVQVLAGDRKGAVVWPGVDSLRALWRVRWALAEARHTGFCVLDNPRVNTPGWFPVSSMQVSLDLAREASALDLQQVIDVECEPVIIYDDWDVGLSAAEREEAHLREVGLMLRPGPRLRQRHGSTETKRWRNKLASSIRAAPTRTWSRSEIAIFASLARDRKKWPVLEYVSHQRHVVENLLRTRSSWPAVLAIPAGHLNDSELVSRWEVAGDTYGVDVAEVLGLGERMWDMDTPYDPEVPSPETVLQLGDSVGWDPPRVASAAARVAESLLGQQDRLREFLEEMVAKATRDLGADDPSLVGLTRISFLATALADAPELTRARVNDMALDFTRDWPWSRLGVSDLDLAGACVLLANYSRAIELLESHVSEDSQEFRLYLVALRASGAHERARAELTHLLGGDQELRTYLGDSEDPNGLAREFLLTRLRAF